MDAQHARVVTDFFVNLMRREFGATKKVLAAVPDSARDYRPDAKSRTAWELATHLATADVWFLNSIAGGAFTPASGTALPAEMSDVAGVVAWYDREFPAALARVQAMSPEQMTRTLDFFGMAQAPATAFLGLANNHGIHHRGQLASYLRAMGSKVPAIYGMSADERAAR